MLGSPQKVETQGENCGQEAGWCQTEVDLFWGPETGTETGAPACPLPPRLTLPRATPLLHGLTFWKLVPKSPLTSYCSAAVPDRL